MVSSLTEALFSMEQNGFYDLEASETFISKHGKQNIITGLERKKKRQLSKKLSKLRKYDQNQKIIR